MKKILFTLVALLTTLGISAQSYQNLVQSFIQNSDGTDANYWTTDASKAYFIADLGSSQAFNTISLCFRDQKSSTVDVYALTSLDGVYDSDSKTLTVPETATQSFTVYTENNSTNPESKTLTLDEAATAQYVLVKLSGAFNTYYTLNLEQTYIYNTNNKAIFASTTTTLGKVTMGGFLTNDNKSVLEGDDYETAAVIDLTNVEIDTDVTSIGVKNPNALLLVTEAQSSSLTGINFNLVRMDGASWYYALTPINYDDNYTFFSTGDNINHTNTNTQGWTFTRTIAQGSYATVALPIAYTLPSTLQAFTLSSFENNTITFTEVTASEGETDVVLTAKTPYVVYAKSATTITLSGTGDFNWQDNNQTVTAGDVTMHMANQDITGTADDGYYAFQNATSGDSSSTSADAIKLGKVVGGKIKAGRAYFTLSNENVANSITINFDSGETTGISNVNANAAKSNDDAIYTLSGVRVASPAKGIYIKNGKKFIVK